MDISEGGEAMTKRHTNKQQQSQSASSGGRNLIPAACGLNASLGDLEFSEKSKKEKVRSLSAVAKALSMGCRVSHSQKPTKKFKLPIKFLKDCNGVDHASVPRKIRSGGDFIYVELTAVKKRGRESFFGDSEKVNHRMNGMESPQKDGIKKSKKQRTPGWSTRQVSPGPITKDEEEVVETLYALAGMFPSDKASNVVKSELDSESLPENSTVLQDQEESQSANVTLEASGATQDAGEKSPTGCKKASSLNETIGQEQTDFPESANFLVATDNTAPKTNPQAVPMMVKTENGGNVALHDSQLLSLEMGFSSAAKAQDWMKTAMGVSKQDLMETCSSGGKAGKEHELFPQTIVHQGSKCGVLTKAHNLNWMRSGNSHATQTVYSATTSNSRETKNGILQHDLYHEAPPTPGVYDPQKQCFNFLSLSTGVSDQLKANEIFNKGESKLEPYSKQQLPYFQSLQLQQQRQHGLMPVQSSPYASTFLDQLPVAGPQVRLQQQHLPHYYGTPLRGSHYSSTVSYKQQHQSFWAVQLAAQGGSSSVNCSIVRAQYPNWQNGRHDSSVPQVILPHSPASLETFGSKITSISDQHLFTLASSRSRANGQDIHLASSVCEESKGRFRSSNNSGTPSLQLLCDERI
ncbi:hypothetical protein JHK82_014168 [Glycine max]|nr:hypothetical protein JHK82_014168 [Glycine max]